MKHLQRDLEQLKKDVLTCGSFVQEAMDKAVDALLNRRIDLADEVIRSDSRLDNLEVAVEESCLKILALHQPVAGDLRFIVAVMKVNNDLERMGDLAVNIAERARYLSSHDPIGASLGLSDMATRVQDMVRESLESLVNRDAILARRVFREDDAVDSLNRRMYQELQAIMARDPDKIKRAVHALSVSRHLERIADLATNIAEDVVFMVDGEIIRHKVEEYL